MSTATQTLTAILIALATALTPHLTAEGSAQGSSAPSAPTTTITHEQAGVGGSLDPESLARVLGEQQALQDAQNAAQQAEAERLEQERVENERAAQEATEQTARDAPPVEAEPPVEPVVAPVAPVLTQTEVAHQTLAGLPGAEGVSILWDSPELQGHAGAVWRTSDVERGSVIMLTRSKLDQYGYAESVVKHEIFHVYQNRAIFSIQATEGVDWATAEARLIERLDSVYGPGLGLEHSADCGARQAFGATWTHYTTTCPAGSEAVTNALIASQGTW